MLLWKNLQNNLLGKNASFIQLLQMTAAYRASLRKLMMEAWSLREIPANGKSSISTLSPVSDGIRERKTERKRTLCGTKSMWWQSAWAGTIFVLYFYSANHVPYTDIDVIFLEPLYSFIGIVISVNTRKSRKIHWKTSIWGKDTNRITYVKERFFHSFMLFGNESGTNKAECNNLIIVWVYIWNYLWIRMRNMKSLRFTCFFINKRSGAGWEVCKISFYYHSG